MFAETSQRFWASDVDEKVCSLIVAECCWPIYRSYALFAAQFKFAVGLQTRRSSRFDSLMMMEAGHNTRTNNCGLMATTTWYIQNVKCTVM